MTLFDTNYPDEERKKEELTFKQEIIESIKTEYTVFCWLFAIFGIIVITLSDIPRITGADTLSTIFMYCAFCVFFIIPIWNPIRKWFVKRQF